MNASIYKIWNAPAFSSLLQNRREVFIITAAGALHLGLSMAGLPAWQCPVLAATGMPCPGCGLTRATMELLRGDFSASFQTHAFAPIFLLGLVVMLATIILPDNLRSKLIEMIQRIEMRNGITSLVLCLLMFYWAFRLIA